MDGTIFDTERSMAIIVRDVMMEFGYNPPNFIEWYYQNASGNRDDVVVGKLVKKFGIDINQTVINRFNEYREAYYIAYPPQVKEGFFELITFLKSKKIKIGICSNSKRPQILNKLQLSGILMGDFDIIIDGSMVEKPKPYPDPYLLACKKLGVKPKHAIALEDSDHGVESAYRAGLVPILIPDVQVNSPEKKALAKHIVKSLDEVIGIIS